MKKRNAPINWSEGEAKTKEEIDERISQRLISSTSFLEALMQESPFMQEHVKIIPVGFDTTEHERFWHTRHYEEGGNAYNRHTD